MATDKGVIEATDMFPFATNIHDEQENQEYLMEMLKCLRDVNVDHTAVGWYQSVNLDAALQPAFLETQAAYQSEIPNSHFLIYDHLRSAQGVPAIRAFRLRDSFLQAWREGHKFNGRIAHDLLADLVANHVVVELPIKIKVSAMDKLIMGTLAQDNELPEANILGSEAAHRLVLSRLAHNLLLSLDDSIAESNRVQHYVRSVGKQQQALAHQRQKRKADNVQRIQNSEAPLPEDDLVLNLKGISDPSRMGLLYSSVQLSSLLEVCEETFAAFKAKQSL